VPGYTFNGPVDPQQGRANDPVVPEKVDYFFPTYSEGVPHLVAELADPEAVDPGNAPLVALGDGPATQPASIERLFPSYSETVRDLLEEVTGPDQGGIEYTDNPWFFPTYSEELDALLDSLIADAK
jgi:hypothetical protein